MGPLLLLVLRSLQGFAYGGEYAGSIVFLVEHAPKAKRGFYGSFADVGANSGMLFAMLIAWLVNYYFNDKVWAWRLLFFLGVLVTLVGWFIRRKVDESQLFREITRVPESHFDFYREYIKQLRPMAIIIGLILFGTVLIYLIYVFMLTYMTTFL